LACQVNKFKVVESSWRVSVEALKINQNFWFLNSYDTKTLFERERDVSQQSATKMICIPTGFVERPSFG